jgi:hypothetical protein
MRKLNLFKTFPKEWTVYCTANMRGEFKESVGKDVHHRSAGKGTGVHRCCSQHLKV